ncbi:uncharacterized protein LOC112346527 [Selaginella moellendorffii]|uniref:uncharacterized protein LOC112346527 n=1 Tax=Selaginella moellendorffii TaxID=88036 RepID=UPI000D1D064B|nr:uncharacterized protein LOC112346527 [Selaginella moellendorffii]|eukprot:XP_024531447.1 uncharacterized protein LOC112346527 [Selaginella moellendorffii]
MHGTGTMSIKLSRGWDAARREHERVFRISLAINPKDFSTKRVFCLVLQPLISRSVVYHFLIALEDKFGSRCSKNKIKTTAFDFTTLSCVVYHRPRALEKPDARKPLSNYRNHSVESVDSWGNQRKGNQS